MRTILHGCGQSVLSITLKSHKNHYVWSNGSELITRTFSFPSFFFFFFKHAVCTVVSWHECYYLFRRQDWLKILSPITAAVAVRKYNLITSGTCSDNSSHTTVTNIYHFPWGFAGTRRLKRHNRFCFMVYGLNTTPTQQAMHTPNVWCRRKTLVHNRKISEFHTP